MLNWHKKIAWKNIIKKNSKNGKICFQLFEMDLLKQLVMSLVI